MEESNLRKIKEQYDKDSVRKVSYTIVVNDKESKYGQVYSGTCCQSELIDFVSCTNRKKTEPVRKCGCVVQ